MSALDEQRSGDSPWMPQTSGEAAGMMLAGLSWLARASTASVPVSVQANCLRDLERAASMHAAAQARALAGFTAQRGFEVDGQGSARTWLTWQTRITAGAARGAVGWMRRLDSHPQVAEALASGVLSVSWARQLTDWTDALPADARGDADAILLAAAGGGTDLAGLAELFEEIRRRVAGPDGDGDDGFLHRGLALETTFGGAGRLTGNLSARCAAALQSVLESLGKKMGAEDTRTVPQRDHDALEEACRRLLGAGCLPERAGQPVRLQLHMTLQEYLNGIGAPGRGWLPPGFGEPPRPGTLRPGSDPDGGEAGGAGGDGRPVIPGPWAGPGDDCDAALAPILTGRIDHDLAGRLAGRLAGLWAECQPGRTPCADSELGGCGGPHGRGDLPEPDSDGTQAWQGRIERNKAAARELILRHAIALLSGPGGLASWLRTGTLPGPAASVSLPLDVGTVTDLVPPHLRRAITTRDRRCAAPGCDVPPAACHVHHIIPRSQGGTTSLGNCILLCAFHHLILVHRWGWVIRLNADGTTTATSPHGRTLHSHSPPTAA
ncbi:MAG: DUF222 domain-containing protein [Streptosporangiaceae bacterium]